MIEDFHGRNWTLVDMRLCVGQGWGELIEKLYWICDAHNLTVTQVKEKYGGLRFYVCCAPDEVLEEIDRLEKQSLEICENCGDPGKLKNVNGWLSTRCEKCK